MNSVVIITALPAESRVFIDTLKLRHVQDCGWRLFAHGPYWLLQTGLGKLKAASATSALLHCTPGIRALINTGIAGGQYPLGSALLASQVKDAGSGINWYPHLPSRRLLSLPCAPVLTLDSPSSNYDNQSLFDMEAAGIISAATPYLSTDAMQCIKVVSDNPEHSPDTLNADSVTELMQAAIEPTLCLADYYHAQGKDQPAEAVIELCQQVCASVHHTISQQHQLQRLFHQHFALTQRYPDPAALAELGKAKAIEQHLQQTLSDNPLRYGCAG